MKAETGGTPQGIKEERSTARLRCEIHLNKLSTLTGVENYFLNMQFVICWLPGDDKCFQVRRATAATTVIPSLLCVSTDKVVDSLVNALTSD